jgi:hypothetical protein
MAPSFGVLTIAISEATHMRFGPADAGDLQLLRDMGFPETVVDFYAKYEPQPPESPDDPAANSPIRLLSIRGMVSESTILEPGATLAPFGFVVLATTKFGDAILFDGRVEDADEPTIVRASHESVYGNVDEASVDSIVEAVAPTLSIFLEQLANGEIKP